MRTRWRGESFARRPTHARPARGNTIKYVAPRTHAGRVDTDAEAAANPNSNHRPGIYVEGENRAQTGRRRRMGWLQCNFVCSGARAMSSARRANTRVWTVSTGGRTGSNKIWINIRCLRASPRGGGGARGVTRGFLSLSHASAPPPRTMTGISRPNDTNAAGPCPVFITVLLSLSIWRAWA